MCNLGAYFLFIECQYIVYFISGMFGFHDRLLTLRKALHEFLTKSQFREPLWRRWRWQVSMQNKQTGIILS